MNTPASCSLSLIHARDAEVSVILRRGPSRYVRCILWDRMTNHFEDGQWLHASVHASSFSLSPNGKHMIYGCGKHSPFGSKVGGHYVAISRPPYFTALALYPNSMKGHFLDKARYVIDHRTDVKDTIRRAEGLRRAIKVDDSSEPRNTYRHEDGSRVHLSMKDSSFLTDGRRIPPATDIESEGGCLYRRSDHGLELIRDFSDMTFKPIRAPYDWRTHNRDVGHWHPLDADDG